MANADSLEVSSGDRAALDAFTTELIAAGFSPVGGDEHRWTGPIDPSFGSLTSAQSMRFEIRDGWPARHPYIFVDGLTGRRHVNAHGNVCLWDEADASLGWLHLKEIRERIRAWCDDQLRQSALPALDTHLYFDRWQHQLVLLDLEGMVAARQIRLGDGEHGRLRARLVGSVYEVGNVGPIPVQWYYRDKISAIPNSVETFSASLTDAQRADFTSLSAGRGRRRTALAMLLWPDGDNTAITVVLLTRGKAPVALEIARNDLAVLRLRAGLDAPVLANKSTVIFGVGAVGSHLALLLARCGLGSCTLIDGQVLRPGDVVRHASSSHYVGMAKAQAMKKTIESLTSTTTVRALTSEFWTTDALRDQIRVHDMAIDATGNAAYTDLVSTTATLTVTPLVAVALHRQGMVARVRVQATHVMPIFERSSVSGFPLIPALPTEPILRWETGCGAPVNNAPPWSVSAAAALATHTVVDVLARRLADDLDLIDVYEPFDPPFDRRGIQVIRPKGA